jgi:uncharacterized glyoxalase superfamily protein PhnB
VTDFGRGGKTDAWMGCHSFDPRARHGRGARLYTGQLEFTLDSGGEGATNSSLTRGDARLMIETAADHYGDEYNVAIRERLGTQSCIALYIEAEDLADFHYRLKSSGAARIIDPIAARPWGQEEFTVEDHEGNWLAFWRKPDQA